MTFKIQSNRLFIAESHDNLVNPMLIGENGLLSSVEILNSALVISSQILPQSSIDIEHLDTIIQQRVSQSFDTNIKLNSSLKPFVELPPSERRSCQAVICISIYSESKKLKLHQNHAEILSELYTPVSPAVKSTNQRNTSSNTLIEVVKILC